MSSLPQTIPVLGFLVEAIPVLAHWKLSLAPASRVKELLTWRANIDSETALAQSVLIHGPISRSDLTRRLDLSPASLTRLAKPLLDRGLLVELGEVADGSVGRRSRPLDVAKNVGSFIGIKLTGDRLYAVHTNVRAQPLGSRSHPIKDASPEGVVKLIEKTIGELKAEDLVGVGVSLGGTVRDGIVENAPFLGWQNVPFAELLTSKISGPVAVENDLIALAEAERWFGIGKDLPGFVVVTIGAGVGYALVVNGETVVTPDAGTGTGGHIPLSSDGSVCPDGHRGCSRALLTSPAISNQVSAALGRPVSYEEALKLAADGDPAARTIIDDAADALGTFFALAANFTLQSSIVLAGEGVGLYLRNRDRVTARVDQLRSTSAKPVTVQVDESGFDAWARGAATIAIQSALHQLPTQK